MEIVGGLLIFLAVLMVPIGIIGFISPKTVSPKDKPPYGRAHILGSFALGFFVLGIAGGAMVGSSESPKVAKQDTSIGAANDHPDTAAASSEVEPAVSTAAPAQTHNYSMRDGDLYGYQPAISDSERNQGVATKALVMVRYRGERNGLYTVEMPDDSGAIYRMECKSPCEYIKTKVIAAGEVLKSETVPNTPGSLMAAVFDDVLSEQLEPTSSSRQKNAKNHG